jgi:MFS family permease
MWMIGYSIVIVGASAFYFPAINSLLPTLVEDKHLMQANGIHMNIQTISRIIGTALGGLMLVYTSLSVMYEASMIAYFILFLFTLQLKVEKRPVEGNQKSADNKSKSSSFKEVIPVIQKSPAVVMALFLTLVPTFFIGSFNLMVLKISELQDDTAIKGLLYTAEGVSFMLGAFLIKRISRGRNLITLLLVFASAAAAAQMALYFADYKIASILTFALFGWAAGSFYPMTATLFQKSIPASFHGRFFSFRGMMDRILFQIVLLGTGFLLDMIGFKWMVLSFGVLSIGLVMFFVMKQMRNPLSFNEAEGRG